MNTATASPISPQFRSVTAANTVIPLPKSLERQSSSVIQALPAAVIILDHRGMVSDANPAAIALLGEPLFNQRWLDVITRSFQPRSDDGLEVSLKDGRRVKLQISVLPGAEGMPAGQLIMLTDLTQTRQLQSRLAHMQRLSTLGKMMASLAHQIRTPLSSAMLYAQNLANNRVTLQVQQQFQQKLVARLQELEQQVNDMLLFARSGSAQAVAPFTVQQLFTQLTQSTEALLQQYQGTLYINVEPQPLWLVGNQNTLCGALQNLLQNSLQASAGQACINISAFVRAGDSKQLVITVSDNGPGIATDLQPHIFEPFYTSRSQGTGLGLAVVQAVVNSHQGEVRYLPQASGACFEITLPLQAEAKE